MGFEAKMQFHKAIISMFQKKNMPPKCCSVNDHVFKSKIRWDWMLVNMMDNFFTCLQTSHGDKIKYISHIPCLCICNWKFTKSTDKIKASGSGKETYQWEFGVRHSSLHVITHIIFMFRSTFCTRAPPSRNGMPNNLNYFSILSDEFMTDNHDGPQRLVAVATWRETTSILCCLMLFAQFVIAHVLWCDLVRMMVRAKKTMPNMKTDRWSECD